MRMLVEHVIGAERFSCGDAVNTNKRLDVALAASGRF